MKLQEFGNMTSAASANHAKFRPDAFNTAIT